jgi:hypothetical protein
LRTAATSLYTYVQGHPFVREEFVDLISDSVQNVDPRIKDQCKWLVEWFVKPSAEGGATDQEMRQFLTSITGIPVITAYLKNTKIKFQVASTPGVFMHTCFNQIDISPELTQELFIPTIKNPSIVERINAM